jgi:hypothetical protein
VETTSDVSHSFLVQCARTHTKMVASSHLKKCVASPRSRRPIDREREPRRGGSADRIGCVAGFAACMMMWALAACCCMLVHTANAWAACMAVQLYRGRAVAYTMAMVRSCMYRPYLLLLGAPHLLVQGAAEAAGRCYPTHHSRHRGGTGGKGEA